MGNTAEPEQGYYVSVMTEPHGGRKSLLLGPYIEHEVAEANAERAKAHVEENYRDGEWWYYGTARAVAKPGRELPPGKLNDIIGLHPAAPDAEARHGGRTYRVTGGRVQVDRIDSSWTLQAHATTGKLVLRDPDGRTIAVGYEDLQALVRENGFLVVGEMGRRGLGWGNTWPHGA